MYCPKCSQEQASEQQRFCSRCGFPLSAVAEVLAAGGVLPSSKKEKGLRRRSPRYEGVRQGVILLMLAVLFLPLVDIIGRPYHEALVFVLLLGGIMRAAYALIFQEGASRRRADAGDSESAEAKLRGGEDAAALPPAGSIPVADFVSLRNETARMPEPSSVAENTTKLL